ncbi:MAG: ester cyclase [Oryzihumus sp.]
MTLATDPETNKKIVRTFVERVQGAGDIDAVGEFIAVDCVDHTAPPGVPEGLAGAEAVFRMVRAAFPDHDAQIIHQLADGDMVATYKTFNGTHRGDFFGVAPTGRHVSMRVMDFVRIRDGKIAEHWNISDIPGLMQQLGVG